MTEGITVQNEEGDVDYGKSKKASQKAVMETALSRFFLPGPVLFFPAIATSILDKLRLLPKNLLLGRALELGLVSIALSVGLPMSIALYEQKAMLTRDQIDDHLKNLLASDHQSPSKSTTKKEEPAAAEEEKRDDDLKYVQKFYFNKGL